MRATRIMTNLSVADIESAKSFYTGYLGLSNEEFNLGDGHTRGDYIQMVADRWLQAGRQLAGRRQAYW